MAMRGMVNGTRDEGGFALATVLGAIALISVIALGGFFIAENTLSESVRVSDENRAYQASSSGLEQELSVFTRENLVLGQSPSGYAYGVRQTINGTDWFIVTVKDSSDDPTLGADEFEMISTGGSKTSQEVVTVRFQSFNLWDMNIAGAENSQMGSGAGFQGNGRIIGKVYVNGDFDWSGNGSLEAGPVFVRSGTFNKQSTGSNVGFSAEPVPTYFDNPPTGTTTNMFTDMKGSAPKLQVPWPTAADMDNWRQWAINDADANKMGRGGVWVPADNPAGASRHPSSGSDIQYTVFNGDLSLGGIDFGKPGEVARDSGGATDEELSGDVIAVQGNTLYVNGVVYIDGTLELNAPIDRYRGKGLLVARDGIVINTRLVPDDYYMGIGDRSPGDNILMPATNTSDCLGLATLGNVTQNVADWVAGAVFASGKYTATPTAAKFRGSIIANGIDFNQPNVWLVTQPGLSANLPQGMPKLNNLNAKSDWIRR